ncbi:MDR family MFS transporter [Kroppenstedtia pulmonis]|nr:MFS transporter [Kroppenstedtia pulmonis]
MTRLRLLLQEYHPLVWVLVGGTVFARAAAFMSLPFLAVYLSRTTGMNPVLIGLTVGLGPLAGTFGGFVGGYLSDRFGRKVVMLSTLFVWAGVFFGFALAEEVAVFMALNLLNGLCRSFFEPTSQALMADITPPDKRMRVFSIRYLAINVGAAVGPLVGAYLAIVSAGLTFLITGAVYLLYGMVLLVMMKRLGREIGSTPPKERVRLMDALQVVRKDTALGFFILAGILEHIGYSQVESSLPLHLKELFGGENVLYPFLLALNAGTVILFQIVITRWSEKRSILSNMILGSLMFALGLICWGIGGHWGWFVTGMIILTIGEILIFPTSSLFIDRLAPEGMRGTYFGASGFRSIGFFIGPFLGGWLLDVIGGSSLYFLLAGVVACSIVFYWLGQRSYREIRGKVKGHKE